MVAGKKIRRRKKSGSTKPTRRGLGDAEPRPTLAGASSSDTRHATSGTRSIVTGLLLLVVVVGSVALLISRDGGVRVAWESGSAAGYNVLLITLDTTRADHLGCYGDARARTPAIDRLAAQGIRYADAVTPVPMTLPAHATMLTGLDPTRHGVRNNGEYRLGEEYQTLAESLRDRGYETGAFLSAFVLDARFGLAQGFDRYDCDMSATGVDRGHAEGHGRSAELTTDAAIDWLQSRDGDEPFFCWLHYFSPHMPYAPPPRFASQFPRRPYDGEIAYMDSQIDRVLKLLDREGLTEKTVILVVGDHGEGLGEHDEATHGFLMYESVMRVPFILRCPAVGLEPRVVDDVVVSIADVFPTVFDLLGLGDLPTVDGISLRLAQQTDQREIYLESLAPYLEYGWAPLFGIRRHVDKFILAPAPEYYHLGNDPGEQSNLFRKSGGPSAAWTTLASSLDSLLEEQPSIRAVAAQAEKPDPESTRLLQSLGYIGGLASHDDGPLLDPKDMAPVKRAINESSALFAAGRFAEALGPISRARKVAPRCRRLLDTIAKILFATGNIAEAETAIRESLELKPTAEAYHLLAQLLIEQWRLVEAASVLDQGTEVEPGYGGLWLGRGDLMLRQERYSEAIQAYERAIEVDPNRSTGYAQQRIEIVRLRMDASSS